MAHPDIFYKYTTASTSLIVLENTRLRWSSPFLFDDPAEFRRMPCFTPSIAEAAKSYPATIIQAALGKFELKEQDLIRDSKLILTMIRALINHGVDPKELAAEIGEIPEASDEEIDGKLREFFNDQFISTARVLCVSTDFENDALWVNYADNFKGCVLGFRHIPALSTPFLAAKQVTYSEHLPTVGSGMDLLLYGGTRQLREVTLDAVCFTKKHHWSYQNEWRAVTWRDEEGNAQHGDYKFYPEELESVTLGMHSTAETEASVAQLIRSKYAHCNLYRLTYQNGKIGRVQVEVHAVGA